MFARDIILQFLPILLNDESFLAHGLIAHVIQNLIKSLIMLCWEICSHLLLVYQGASGHILLRTVGVAGAGGFVQLPPGHQGQRGPPTRRVGPVLLCIPGVYGGWVQVSTHNQPRQGVLCVLKI